MGNLIVILLLLAANGYFVAAEFALVKLKGFRLEAMTERGSRVALLTQKIHDNLEVYLAACQLGITMASLGLGWVGEPFVATLLTPLLESFHLSPEVIHKVAFLLGFILFSSLHIVVGEQVPKTFAIRKPEAVSLWVSYPLHWFYLLVYPLNWLLNSASRSFLSMFGVEEATHQDIFTDEDIKSIIETSEETGNIESEKAAMLQNLFEFEDRTAEEVMVPRAKVSSIDLQDTWEDNLEVLRNTQHSRFPVTDGGDNKIVGVLLVKDLYNLLMINREENIASHLRNLIRNPMVIPETQKLGKLFEQMRNSRQHMSIVIDEYGTFAGIVTMEDLLEEIVGEIEDELDMDGATLSLVHKGGGWEADGWTQISDIERTLDIQFEESLDANTLSGLFMYRLQRVPEVGDSITEQGYKFKIVSMNGRRVNLTRIEKVALDDSDPGLP
ncbi:MAG: HlyC/CorC family transporter [Bdellovibrionaceae bacterium]|nr:HlyC/CorC family transporter [Bdellovibrionales bacterium]MCB9083430.1 HlyC/CorC family transporter [Pseudobdellovibrionaceae bacterium]